MGKKGLKLLMNLQEHRRLDQIFGRHDQQFCCMGCALEGAVAIACLASIFCHDKSALMKLETSFEND
jgi:hypothetical protein